MKLSANRTELHAVCKKLSKVASDTSTVEIFSGILFEADAENLEIRLTAMNIEVSLCYVVSAAVRESGRMVINASLLAGMLSLLGGSVVKIESVENKQVKLSSGRASYVVGTLLADEFPTVLLPTEYVTTEISNISELINNTLSVALHNNGASGKCLKLELAGSVARMISTDGSRLMVCQKNQMAKNEAISFLISPASLKLLSSVIDPEETLMMSVGQKQAVFKTQTMTMSTRLINSIFIDAQAVLRNISKCHEAFVDGNALYVALDAADVVATTGDYLQMVFKKDCISIACNGENGKVSLTVPARGLMPTPPEGFYYPSKKLLQSISPMSGTLRLSTDRQGILIVQDGDKVLLMSPVTQKAVLARIEKRGEKPVKKAKKETKEKTKKTAKAAA